MSRELKPCPFCPDGGDPNHFGGAGHHCVKCSKCGRTNEKLVWTESDGWHYEAFDSAQEAYDDWNTRYKRTCKSSYCKETDEWQCHECGGTLQACAMFDPEVDGFVSSPKFCPNCGAEVVDGE